MVEIAPASELRSLRLQAQLLQAPRAVTGAGSDSGPGSGSDPGGSPSPAAVVRHLLAIQAQDFAQGLWAVGVRSPTSVRSDVLAALADGSVVRSAPVRGTLHLVAAEDLRWILALTAERTLAGAATRFRQLDLDAATFEHAERVTRRDLAGGGAASRDEYLKILQAAGISTEGQRGYHIIFYLSHRAVVCWGPPRGNQQALVLADEWIPHGADPLPREENLRRLAVRYVIGHGPATVRDLAWWSKLTLADTRLALSLARDELREYTVGETSYFAAPGTEPEASAPLILLPGFDEYLLGYQDRSLVLADGEFERVAPGKNGIILPIIVAGGRVVGTWKRTPAPTAEPFGQLTARQATAFARAAAHHTRFLAG